MKKGFSLIELLVVMSIIAIVASISLLGISKYKNLKNDVDLNMTETSILGIINYGKQYCREKEKPGFILFDLITNEIGFYSENREIDVFRLPSDIKIEDINTSSNKLDIDKFGIISDAGTILLRDCNNKLFSLTINVGAGYAEIK
jgi:prepilin-type N-terminal cleavage/methylation domain-containing protein